MALRGSYAPWYSCMTNEIEMVHLSFTIKASYSIFMQFKWERRFNNMTASRAIRRHCDVLVIWCCAAAHPGYL